MSEQAYQNTNKEIWRGKSRAEFGDDEREVRRAWLSNYAQQGAAMKPGDKVSYNGREVDGILILIIALVILVLVLVLVAMSGCAARKPAIRPGHDREHPSLTPVGKVTCRTGLLKLFGSYGPRNCVNEQHPPTPYCDGKNPCKCEGEFRYNEYEQRCERLQHEGEAK